MEETFVLARFVLLIAAGAIGTTSYIIHPGLNSRGGMVVNRFHISHSSPITVDRRVKPGKPGEVSQNEVTSLGDSYETHEPVEYLATNRLELMKDVDSSNHHREANEVANQNKAGDIQIGRPVNFNLGDLIQPMRTLEEDSETATPMQHSVAHYLADLYSTNQARLFAMLLNRGLLKKRSPFHNRDIGYMWDSLLLLELARKNHMNRIGQSLKHGRNCFADKRNNEGGSQRIGKRLVGRRIPIRSDRYVSPSAGSMLDSSDEDSQNNYDDDDEDDDDGNENVNFSISKNNDQTSRNAIVSRMDRDQLDAMRRRREYQDPQWRSARHTNGQNRRRVYNQMSFKPIGYNFIYGYY